MPDFLTTLRGLMEAATELNDAAKRYMQYHSEKFYGGMESMPTGTTPASTKFDEALKALDE
jgi:hypothetical protein